MTTASNGRLTPGQHAGAEFFAAHWSKASPRNDAAAALAGGLLRADWSVETVEAFVGEVAERAGDEEAHKRVARVAETADKLKAGAKVTGWPKLVKLLGADGENVVRRLRVWLGLVIDLAAMAADKGLPVEFLRGLGLHDLPQGVGIPYKDGAGNTVAVKHRTALRAKDGSCWPLGKKLMAYGEERLEEGAAAGYRVIVEGESDCWTLWHHGFPALGLPGSNSVAKTLTAGHVFGVPLLYVVREPDGGGEQFIPAVAAKLAELRWRGELRVVRLDPHKDPNDLHRADPEGFSERFRQALAQAEVCPPAPPPGTPGRRPRTVAPYAPFPVDALPAPLGEYIREGAVALGCDPAYLALPILSVIAAVIGGTRTIRLKRGWEEPSVVWSTIVGDSGTLKSPAYLKAVAYLFRLQKRLLVEHRAAAATFQQELADYKVKKKAFEQAKKNGQEAEDPGDQPEPPVLRRVICSDTTIEKLAQILEDNPRGTLLARDELAGWLGSFCRYKGKTGGSDLPNWLEMFRAGTVIVDRKTGDRPTLFIPHAAVSIAGGIQPGVLVRALTPEFLDAGLAARVLMAMPPKLPKRWSEAEIGEDTERAYQCLLDGLLGLQFGANEEGERVPQVLRLSQEGQKAWVAFYNAWAREQATAEGELAAAFSKLEAYAARFALLHHVVSRAGRGEDDLVPVGPDSIEAGVALCKWFAAEARRIYSILTESAEEHDTRRLVEFIRARGGRITAAVLHRSNSRKYPDADSAARALDQLAEAGYGYWQDRPGDARGGRPTREFVLHPTCGETYETHETPPGDDGDGCEPPGGAPDETPLPSDDTPENPEENGVSSVSSVSPESSEQSEAAGEAVKGAGGPQGVSSVAPNGDIDPFAPEVLGNRPDPPAEAAPTPEGLVTVSESSLPTAWRLVKKQADLSSVVHAVDESVRVGLDTETTGLDPRKDRVRLLTLATERGTWLIDCFAVDPAPLWDVLAEREVIAHNATFDLGFLHRLGFVPAVVHDTILLSRLLHGTRHAKGYHGLEECAARELGRTLDKRHQKSDWSGVLTAEQLAYAVLDAAVLVPLYQTLDAAVREAGMERVAGIERRCLPAVAWLADSGVGFDAGAWAALAQEAASRAEGLAGELDEAAPARDGYLSKTGAWDWDSPAQVKEAFALLGYKIENTNDDTLAGVDHPLAGLLRDYRAATKLVSTYGPKWCAKALDGGRIYAGWQQVGADSGRMACKAPNLQNLPRDKRYRRCFVAPDGRLLVKADYSQVELRIAAKVANEARMLAAYQSGEDLHTLTARNVLGISDVTREHRQLAKAVNFGLLYGMGAAGFRAYALANYGLRLTEEEATRYRDAFFAAYPGLRRWHRSVPKAPIATRTLAGRRRQNVERYTEKLNTPVQGTGADGLKLALALLWERRAECPGALPVLAVHDEIVVECDAGQADAAKGWVTRAMADALAPLIDPVPVEVEATVGRTWAGD